MGGAAVYVRLPQFPLHCLFAHRRAQARAHQLHARMVPRQVQDVDLRRRARRRSGRRRCQGLVCGELVSGMFSTGSPQIDDAIVSSRRRAHDPPDGSLPPSEERADETLASAQQGRSRTFLLVRGTTTRRRRRSRGPTTTPTSTILTRAMPGSAEQSSTHPADPVPDEAGAARLKGRQLPVQLPNDTAGGLIIPLSRRTAGRRYFNFNFPTQWP